MDGVWRARRKRWKEEIRGDRFGGQGSPRDEPRREGGGGWWCVVQRVIQLLGGRSWSSVG